ncbi:hypothetical protein AFLA70_327g001212, partial [Aspergillus flavus AF70]
LATLWLSTIWSLGGDEAGVDVVAEHFVPLTKRERFICLPVTDEKRRALLASGGNTSLVPESRGESRLWYRSYAYGIMACRHFTSTRLPGVFLAVSSSSLNGVTGLDSGSTGTPIVQETSRRKDHGTIGIEVQVQYQSIRTDPGSRTLSNNEQ